MSDTPQPTLGMYSVFAAISRNKPSTFIDKIPELADYPDAAKGFHDRRAIALRYIDSAALAQAMPVATGPQLMFEACLDVLGEILMCESPQNAMQGVQHNITAAQQRIADPTLPRLTGYDTESYMIAREILGKIAPDLYTSWQGRYRLDDDPENITRAVAKTLPHFLLQQRVAKNLDMLSMVLEPDGRDLNAFAWILSQQIQDKPTEDELFDFSIFMNDTNGEKLAAIRLMEQELLVKKGPQAILSLQELFNKSEPIERKLKELTERYKTASKRNKKNFKLAIRLLRKQLNDIQKKHGYNNKLGELNIIHLMRKLRDSGDMETPLITALYQEFYNGSFSQPRILPASKGEIIKAETFITPEEGKQAVEGLYKYFAEELNRTNRQARLLAQQLRAAYEVTCFSHLEEGSLDPAALPIIITDPLYQRPYMRRDENDGATLDTAVTLLVDNSESMTDNHKIQLAFIAAERLSFWLSQCGLATEILGFTNRQSSLNAIIYKERHEPHVSKMVQKMAAMLNTSLSGGTPLGEAVDWAHRRLITAHQRRKILMVISDGEPSHSHPKVSLKPAEYLKSVVADIEQNSPIEIVGVGIQHDVSDFYSQSIQIDQASDLSKAMTTALKQIILPPARSKRHGHGRRISPARTFG